ncbi:MAG TPA: ribosome maturation factor RimP [Thermoanaerobaculia bacterium]|nr:ribosome maturation factor RimP [Thermoanaerobaculia bacterium]
MAELPAKVQQEIEKIASSEGLELVHIEYRRQGATMLLRIDIDKEGGVNISDCANVSHQLSAFLDVEDVISSAFELQVSSPGLDRKFYSEADYGKFIGKLVRVKTAAAVKGLHVVVGHLQSFDGEKIVVIDPASRKDYEIGLADIKETRLEVEI